MRTIVYHLGIDSPDPGDEKLAPALALRAGTAASGRRPSLRRQQKRVRMRKLAAALVGIVTIALLFPTGGTTGCADGTGGGTCESWSDSILVRYPGENGAIGMGIALGAGLLAAVLLYQIAQRFLPRKG